jgi:hypothetical protein
VTETQRSCVLLFSGGRDSTLAAIRLSSIFDHLMLVTVTSGHLVGMESVNKRLIELKSHLKPDTQWLNVVQPEALPSDRYFEAATCLPCHRSYTVIGSIIAERSRADSLAFGYTKYQSAWLEQTPAATACLIRVLQARKIKLSLPVYELASKNDAITQLEHYRLSSMALEQKCTQQQFNVALDSSKAIAELKAWEVALTETLSNQSEIVLEILADRKLGDI